MGDAAIATTPEPPYYAVIFTSIRTPDDGEGYGRMADLMLELAAAQPGVLGADSAREAVGITVSYWRDLESIVAWKRNAEHVVAQRTGRANWYECYTTRIAKVERDYSFQR
jgi:heme-degrading monooxygenase HmoA